MKVFSFTLEEYNMGKPTLDEVIAEYKNKLIPLVQSGKFREAWIGAAKDTKMLISIAKQDLVRADRALWAGQLVLGAAGIERLLRLGQKLRLDQVIQELQMSRAGTLKLISDIGPTCGIALEAGNTGDFVVFKDTKMDAIKAVVLEKIQAL